MTENEATIKLGDKIVLEGFKNMDNASMVIAKKIIGNYTRKISDENPKFENLTLELDDSKGFKSTIKLKIDGKEKEFTNSNSNFFMSLDGAFKNIK
ncbi:hypothetical protein C0585_02240 [Candidatus Woesearchaeota archaeon]|nr:MAG: hypothetical protein C0585_02240 [Candidatus Woesearchaeota archaeon]